MFTYDPKDRITAKAALKHSFLQSNDTLPQTPKAIPTSRMHSVTPDSRHSSVIITPDIDPLLQSDMFEPNKKRRKDVKEEKQ